MIEKIISELNNGIISKKNISYILNLEDKNQLNILYNTSSNIQEKYPYDTKLETNLYLPLAYSVNSNCLTCGYRTPEPKREYSKEYIKNALEYILRDVKKYDISTVNCYTNNLQLGDILLNFEILDNLDLDINYLLNIDEFDKSILRYINGVIIDYSMTNYSKLINNNDQLYQRVRRLHTEILKGYSNILTTCEIMINNMERDIDLVNTFNRIREFNPEKIEIKGYDPFLDRACEYNPQYSKEYLNKIISIIRISFPETEIKIRYATNGNNNLKENLKLGINTITGVNCDKTDVKMYNIEEIITKIDK